MLQKYCREIMYTGNNKKKIKLQNLWRFSIHKLLKIVDKVWYHQLLMDIFFIQKFY